MKGGFIRTARWSVVGVVAWCICLVQLQLVRPAPMQQCNSPPQKVLTDHCFTVALLHLARPARMQQCNSAPQKVLADHCCTVTLLHRAVLLHRTAPLRHTPCNSAPCNSAPPESFARPLLHCCAALVPASASPRFLKGRVDQDILALTAPTGIV